MTINQALDKLTSGNKLTPDQEALKVSLLEQKMKEGGRTMLDNEDEISDILAQEFQEPDETKAD